MSRTVRSWAHRWSFYFLCLFLIFSGISISVSQGALALALLLWIIGRCRGYDDIVYYRSGLERYVLAFYLISFLLAFISSTSITGNLLYLRDTWIASLCFLIPSMVQQRKDVSKIVKVLIFIALFNAVIGIAQYITDIDFLNAFRYGLADKRSHLSYGNRHVIGFLGHHLTYGGYVMMIAIPFLYLSFVKEGQKKERLFIKVSALLSALSVILSWARSVIISLPFGILPLLFRKRKVFFTLFFLVILIVIAIFTHLGPEESMVGNFQDHSTQLRIVMWEAAFRTWLKHPFFGTGGGDYLSKFRKEVGPISSRPEQRKLMIKSKHYKWGLRMLVRKGSHPHNDYLNQLARKGIIGFIAFIYMLFGIFRYMAVHVRTIEDRFYRYLSMGLFGAYCTFLAASMFQCYFTDEENLAMFWFTVGLFAAVVRVANREKGEDDGKSY